MRRQLSLILAVLCCVGAWWARGQKPVGFVSTTVFLAAALISLTAYFKAGSK